ncbi:MAG TPA: hypothetical protein VHB79_32985 [Polyangiaceae bacterium]|nr:hypothetical protein [Polyangiaceae bacterium]
MTTKWFVGSKSALIYGGLALIAACSSTGEGGQGGGSAGSSSGTAGTSSEAGSGGISTSGGSASAAGTNTVGASGSATAGQSGGGAGGSSGGNGGGAGSAGGGQAGTAGMGGAPSGLSYNGAIFYVTRADGTLFAFQTGTWEQVGKWTGLPITDGIRGIDADPATGNIYFTHGGAGPNSFGNVTKNGSLAAWNLYTSKLVYDKKLEHGVDQPSYGNALIYVPAGEFTDVRDWIYYRASDGAKLGTEPGGMNPHDTIYKNGHRYYGGTEDTYLYVIGLPNVTKVGPSPSGTAGVRPFTVNGSETRAYITWSNYRGFSVGDLTTGKIIKSVSFGGDPCHIAPSHGMTLSPDNKEVYVLDTCINQVKAYTATDDPQLIAAIPFEHDIRPGDENPCAWDCAKDGWLMHSRDGKYVYVGDSGDIIDTATHKITHYMPELANCRHGFLEMVWKDGYIVDTSTHVGLGY